MQHALRMMTAAIAAIVLHLSGPAVAQAPIKQIQLTEKHVQGFIAAQKEMTAITEKMQGSTSDKPDPKIQAELESAAQKQGFKDFSEYDDVAANIAMIMSGFDPATKAFTEPSIAIAKEIEEVKADKSIPEKEKKQMLEELSESLKVAQPIQHAGNIDLIRKYFDKIEAALQ